jgi:hypothetical protein
MEVDEFAEGLELADARHCRGLAAIDLSFGVHGPALGIFVANKILADGVAFASDLDAPGAGFLFADRGRFGVQIRCDEFEESYESLRKMA